MTANARKRSSTRSPRKKASQEKRKVPDIELHEQTLERQINLVTALLGSPGPLTLSELQEKVYRQHWSKEEQEYQAFFSAAVVGEPLTSDLARALKAFTRERELDLRMLERALKAVESRRKPHRKDLERLKDRRLVERIQFEVLYGSHRNREETFFTAVGDLWSGKRISPQTRGSLSTTLSDEINADQELIRVLKRISGMERKPLPEDDRLVLNSALVVLSKQKERRERDRIRGMFRRDREDIAEMGLVINTNREGSRSVYSIDPVDIKLPRISLSEDERLALATALRFFVGSGTPFAADALTLLLKLKHRGADMIPTEEVLRLGWVEAPHVRKALDAVSRGLSRNKTLEFTYRSRGADKPAMQEVEPYGLINRSGYWYLVGLSRKHKEIRTFKLDRFESNVREKDRDSIGHEFEVPKDFSLVSESRWPWEKKRVSARVRFLSAKDDEGVVIGVFDHPPESTPAEVLKEKVVEEYEYPRGMVGEGSPRVMKDQYLEVTFSVGDVEEFIGWVLGFGPEVRLVSPPSMVSEVKRRLEAIIERVG